MPSFSGRELAGWCRGQWNPEPPPVLEGICHDSRRVRAGQLYVALAGERFDGHDFVAQAFQRGAAGALVARGKPLPAGSGRPLLEVENPAMALRDMAASYRLKLGNDIVAVTGSAGKSTVKDLTAQMLATTFPTASTLGNWNNDIGLPLSLLAIEAGCRVGVFETGTNHPGEIAALCGILRPTWGLVTNVGLAHIGFFKTLEGTANEKADLLRSLPPDGVAVLWNEDRFFDYFRSLSPARVLTVALHGDADYRCLKRDLDRNQVAICERSSGEEFHYTPVLPGEHNVLNVLFALAVARSYGVEWESIRRALDRFVSLPMRWEEHSVDGIRLVNDAYNANPTSMRAALQAFEEQSVAGAKWLVLGGMLELGWAEKAEHIALGEFVGEGEWDGVLVVGALGSLIAQGAENEGFDRERIFRCGSQDEAARVLRGNAVAGDAVLLKASRSVHLEEVVKAFAGMGRAVNHDGKGDVV